MYLWQTIGTGAWRGGSPNARLRNATPRRNGETLVDGNSLCGLWPSRHHGARRGAISFRRKLFAQQRLLWQPQTIRQPQLRRLCPRIGRGVVFLGRICIHLQLAVFRIRLRGETTNAGSAKRSAACSLGRCRRARRLLTALHSLLYLACLLVGLASRVLRPQFLSSSLCVVCFVLAHVSLRCCSRYGRCFGDHRMVYWPAYIQDRSILEIHYLRVA
jgi:hypothetical protein